MSVNQCGEGVCVCVCVGVCVMSLMIQTLALGEEQIVVTTGVCVYVCVCVCVDQLTPVGAGVGAETRDGGVSTESIMCTTPFEARLSAPVTWAPPLMKTAPAEVLVTRTDSPCSARRGMQP